MVVSKDNNINTQANSPKNFQLPFSIDLDQKTAVITGGGGVLCSFFARALARAGAQIAILDIDMKGANAVVKQIEKEGGKAIAIKTNILKKDELIKAREQIITQFQTCDILINGAGGNHPKGTTSQEYLTRDHITKSTSAEATFLDLDPDGIRFVFDLNFLGAFLSTQVFLPALSQAEAGTIINISSMNAFQPLTKIPAYSAAKAAVSNFTQWLAVHLSKLNIRVNAIAPGFFLTNQNASLLKTSDGKFTKRAEKILDHTPLERFGDPQDLIGTLLWLVENKASKFITGIVVPVDGGFSAYSGV